AWGYGGDFEWRWNDASVTRLAAHYKKDVHRDQQETPPVPLVQLAAATIDVAVEQEWIINPAFSLTPSYQHVLQKGNTVWVYSNNQYAPVEVSKSTANNAHWWRCGMPRKAVRWSAASATRRASRR